MDSFFYSQTPGRGGLRAAHFGCVWVGGCGGGPNVCVLRARPAPDQPWFPGPAPDGPATKKPDMRPLSRAEGGGNRPPPDPPRPRASGPGDGPPIEGPGPPGLIVAPGALGP